MPEWDPVIVVDDLADDASLYPPNAAELQEPVGPEFYARSADMISEHQAKVLKVLSTRTELSDHRIVMFASLPVCSKAAISRSRVALRECVESGLVKRTNASILKSFAITAAGREALAQWEAKTDAADSASV